MNYVAVGAAAAPRRSEFMNAAPPADYVPPLPPRAGEATPESNLGLIAGIGIGVLVLGAGAYFLLKD